MNNFYKIDHRYNTKSPWMAELCHLHRSNTTNQIHTSSSKVATAASLKVEHDQSSYQDKINQIITNCQQLQKEKQLHLQKQEYIDFDQLMAEDLGNQLEVLERKEEEQYQLMEQLLGEQLEQEHQNNSIDDLEEEEEDHSEQFKQLQELETMLEEQEREQERVEDGQFKTNKTWRHHEQFHHLKQFKKYQQQQEQSNKKELGKNIDLFHQKYPQLMNIDIWKQKHDMFLKQIMSKVNSMKGNKIIRLLKALYRTKKYYVQLSKN